MYHFSTRIIFLFGIAIGSILSAFVIHLSAKDPLNNFKTLPTNIEYNDWFHQHRLQRRRVPIDSLRYANETYTLESQFLYDTVKILCVILVKKKKNFSAAKNTWGKGCNAVTYVQLDVAKKVPGKRKKEDSTWFLLCGALKNLSDDFDWYLIVNDSTFVIMENLRLLIAPKDQNRGHYLGHAVKFWSTVYNSGKAGYVISRGSLRMLKGKLNVINGCLAETSFLNQEDFYLGKHLSTLNVTAEDTRDSVGLSRFHIYNWQQEFYPGINYHKNSVFPVVCCSIHSITFKAIDADKMYKFHYLLYQLQIFITGNLGNKLPKPVPKDMIWKAFLKEQGIRNDNISAEEYFNLWKSLGHDMSFLRQEFKNNEDL